MKSRQKYIILFSLYIAQSIPMSFFSTVLPVILRRENFSLETIGMLQLVKLPWIAKFMWAPLVDKFSTNLRMYKRWILYSELFYAVIILAIAFMNLQASFTLIIALMVVAFTASATQDIATDAYATKKLTLQEKGIGNGIQSSGSFIGTLFGSGVILAVYAIAGWQNIMFLLAGIVLIALIPLLVSREREAPAEEIRKKLKIRDFFSFFNNRANIRHVIMLVFYYTGIIGVLAMMKPYLVDMDLSVGKIAFISGIWGTSIAAVGAIGAGFFVRKIGNRISLMAFSAMNLFAVIFFTLTRPWFHFEVVLYIAVALIWLAYAFSSTVVYNSSMLKARPGKEGSDFTLQIVLTHLSGLVVAVSSGKFAHHFGYEQLFLAEIGFALFAFLLVLFFHARKPLERQSVAEGMTE